MEKPTATTDINSFKQSLKPQSSKKLLPKTMQPRQKDKSFILEI